MPRAISAEEALLTSTHEKLQRSKAFETGLVLAHVGGKADVLLRFAPTPEEDGVYTFKKGEVDAKWMVQHAELVAHMLPGGIAVIGCYAFAPNAKLAKLEAALQPVLSFLAKRIQGVRPDSKQALLLLLPSDAKKVSAKTLSVGTDGAVASRLSPIELKLAKETPPLACFAADWAVDASLTLPSSSDSSAQAQAAALAEALVPSVEALEASIATIGGSLPSPAALVSSLGGGGGSVERPHRVALFATSPPSPAGAASGASASVRVTGVVHGRAFATSKDEVGGALEALKRDLASTLRFRLQKFFNDREEEEDDDEDGDEQGPLPTGEACAYALPRRAHFTLGSASSSSSSSSAGAGAGAGAAIFSVCDHLEEDDDATAVASRLSEYLGIGSDESSASALGKAGDAASGADAFEALIGPESAPAALTVVPAGGRGGGGGGGAAPVQRAKPAVQAAGETSFGSGASSGAAAAKGGSGGGGGSGGSSTLLIAGLVVALVGVGVALTISGSAASGDSGAVEAAAAAAVERAAAAAAGQEAAALPPDA